MKKNKFLLVMSIISLFVIMLGATFSYFAAVTNSGQISDLTAANFGAEIIISPLYNEKKLIPMDDSDVMTGYERHCIDDLGYGACYAYNIHIDNVGDKFEYVGTINFSLNGIENLKYLVLDEENNKYVDDTLIISGENQSLGGNFELDTGESRDLVLVVWLSNLAGPQDEQDAGGSFNASVTYESTYGSSITGTFSN